MIEACFVIVLFAIAVGADLAVDVIAAKPLPPPVNWFGASAAVFFALAPLTMLGVAFSTPGALLAQTAVVSVAVGGVVDVPLSLRRNLRAERSLLRTLLEPAGIGVSAAGMVWALTEVVQSQTKDQNWGALG